MPSKIKSAILIVLDEHGQVEGTEHFVLDLLGQTCGDKYYISGLLKNLAANGEIVINKSSGGRGRKTIYKRNRNQAGMPRRTHVS